MSNCRKAVGAMLCACAVLAPLGAGAQPSAGNGFLFGAPHGSISLRGGFAQPSAGSDIFSFVHQHLTVGRGDFAGTSLSGDLTVLGSERLALQFGFGYSARSAPSEYRDWVDNKELPIEQSTYLRRMPLTIGLRYYLTAPGRTLGRLAWVPTRVVPYVAAGTGITWYEFRQAGDFVDYKTLDVFNTTLKSSGWAPNVFGALGANYALTARTGLVAEARYDMASGRMSSDFAGFNRIDLSGVSATLGLTFHF